MNYFRTLGTRWIFLLLASALGAMHAFAEPSAPETASAGPYCGVYSLYAAIRLEGGAIDMESLLQPQYVGSKDGSEIGELRKAATDHGMFAVPLSNLSIASLRYMHIPVILHVRGSQSAKYDHWILFTGFSRDGAKILDGAQLRTISLAELSVNWDGNGLAVSNRPVDLSVLRAGTYGRILSLSFAMFALCGAVHLVHRRVPSLRRRFHKNPVGSSVLQALALFGVSGLLGAGYHAFAGGGFLQHRELVTRVRDAHFDAFPSVTVSQVKAALATNAILIDARLSEDYRQGHIKRARSIPVSSTSNECRAGMAGIDFNNRVIVYCQSSGCPFARTVAQKLAALGYTNIALFPGGWEEWQSIETNR